jgi:hypothetical protein
MVQAAVGPGMLPEPAVVAAAETLRLMHSESELADSEQSWLEVVL